MKETIKVKMKTDMEAALIEKHPYLTEVQAHKIANDMMDIGVTHGFANLQGIQSIVSQAVLDLESYRNQFHEHIEFLQAVSKKIIEILKQKGLVHYEYDMKKKKNVMKGRTNVLTETVEYFNILNDMVIDYYKNVYKIEVSPDKATQPTLF